jgi:hypothetical protein
VERAGTATSGYEVEVTEAIEGDSSLRELSAPDLERVVAAGGGPQTTFFCSEGTGILHFGYPNEG